MDDMPPRAAAPQEGVSGPDRHARVIEEAREVPVGVPRVAQTVEEFEAETERRVREAMAAQFVLDEIAAKEELGVEQNELSEHLVRRAQQSGQDPQEFANHMFEHNHIPDLVQEIRRGKALANIVEAATVTDASGNVVDLKNLRPDGTIGEPVSDDEDAATQE